MYPNDSLKYWFRGKGHWSHINDDDWMDWRWQMRNRIKSKADVEKFLKLSKDEISGLDYASKRLSFAITPYFFNLIDPLDPSCPIRRQVIPNKAESNYIDDEVWDPVGEESHMPVPCIVHKYPDRVLFLVTDRCASYCRYCTRSRLVSNAQGYGFHPDVESGLSYIRNNYNVRDVLLSGGDPLLLSDNKLKYILNQLSELEHIEFIRIGSRIPVFLPQRINTDLLKILSDVKNLWLSIHVNHPTECTQLLYETCLRLAKCGVPLGNQSVLLKGVNDNHDTMKSLIHRLLMMKVRPYYLYQCDLIKGSSHLRTDVKVGLDIIKNLRGHTTGYAIPQFVIDTPGGGGKVPISPDTAKFNEDGSIKLINYSNKEILYPSLKEEFSHFID